MDAGVSRQNASNLDPRRPLNLRGVFLPLTTPFVDDRPAADRLADNIARYQSHGPAGYLLLGSTGEAAYLSEDEKSAVLRAARSAIPPATTMLAGVGLESTRATVRMAAVAAECGADAVLVLTPHYFRSRMVGEALRRHFAAVADASPVPVLLYNVPAFTGVVIPPAVVGELATHPNIAGLKDSSGDLGWLVDVLGRVAPPFEALCGSAFAFQPALAAGAVGGILAAADVFPEPFRELFERQVRGEEAAALILQKEIMSAARLVVERFGVAGVKAAMDERGLAGGLPRAPLLALPPEDRAAVKDAVETLLAAGLLARRTV
jgi:dihydrodipicolinate synthase/N-acetylneuraminate lyase